MLIFIITLVAVIMVAIVVFASDVYLPKSIRYLRYLVHDINPPQDLYVPIVEDKFSFTERGDTKTYSLKPKYSDLYDLGISLNKKVLSSKYKLQGKLKLEFISNNTVLYEEIVDKFKSSGHYFEDLERYDFDWYQQITLHTFEIPLQGRYKKDIGIRITVLEPDLELKEHKDSIRLFIRVSPTP
jgi:hypothetical protein